MSKALAHMKVCFQNKGLHRIWTIIRKLQYVHVNVFTIKIGRYNFKALVFSIQCFNGVHNHNMF